MLIFSNREIQGRADTAPFRQRFPAAFAQRALATLESLSQAPTACWKVSQVDSDVDDADSISTLLPLFRDSRPMLLYLHGYNNTRAACFERCDRLQSLYGLEVVRFSWSSNRHRQGASDLPDFLTRSGEHGYLQANDCLRQLDPAALALDGLTCSWWLVMRLTGSPLH